MKKVLFATCAVLVLGAGMVIGWQNAQKPAVPAKAATRMEMSRLANGTIVFEEVTTDGRSIADIAPAAGDQADPKQPRYKYDPLTQTYRATREDGSQHIISDPRNPGKN